jgi:acetyl-CoA C-acetyltransferase
MKGKATPLIVSSAQYTQRKDAKSYLDPLNLMIKTGKKTIAHNGIKKLREVIDAIFMVNINCWSYRDAPAALAQTLSINPKEKVYLSDGGNTPQMLVNRAAKKIEAGDLKAVLIIGAEAAYSKILAKKGRINLNWPEKEQPAYMEGKLWDGINKFENKYKFKFPPLSYALLETAVMAASGRSLEEHKAYMGKLFQHFSEIAAEDPYAWSQKDYTAEDIITPSEKNRMVCFPYTKRMCSNMFVDMSAAVLMTSEEIAEDFNIIPEQWVYIMGGSDLKNIHEISKRHFLHTSPASRHGSKLALKQAGLKLDDIDAFDLYSCFPSIVEIMMNEIGIQEDDSRQLTLTGGLPYFGGPWSNYSLHAIVKAIKKIQQQNNLKIMVVANGGYNSKQSFGIYGNNPPKIPWNDHTFEHLQGEILKKSLKDPVEKANGQMTVEAYTLSYNRDQVPKEGIAIGKVDKKTRTIAYITEDIETLLELEKVPMIGKSFPVYFDKNLNHNVLKVKD